MWSKTASRQRALFILKHGEELYLIRSRFFRRWLFIRDDLDCPRSQHQSLADKIARKYVELNGQTVKVVNTDTVYCDVKVTGFLGKIDLHLVIIHVDSDQVVLYDGVICVSLTDRPEIDQLVRKRVLRSKFRLIDQQAA